MSNMPTNTEMTEIKSAMTDPAPNVKGETPVVEWNFDSEFERLSFAALSSCGCSCP